MIKVARSPNAGEADGLLRRRRAVHRRSLTERVTHTAT